MKEFYVNPQYGKWKGLLASNLDSNKIEKSVIAQSKELRTLLLRLSSYFSKKLNLKTSDIEFDEDIKLILSAHQPSFDHPGLLAKKQYSNKFASENDCIGINIILDTDSGTDLEFNYIDNNKISSSNIFAEHHHKPYCFQKKYFKKNKLKELNLPSDFIDILNDNNNDFIEALTVFRRTFEDKPAYYEVPFSLLLEQDNMQKFIFEYFLISSKHLFYTYNNVLGIYRALKNIKNKANPFPDLEQYNSSMEVPFWLINKNNETKEPLYFMELEDETVFHTKSKEFQLSLKGFMGFPPLPEGVYVAPRALMTTVILRVFLSDLFVHGKSGEKYDTCTDAFINSFFSFEAPKYVAVSRELMLNKEKAAKVNEYLNLKERTREIAFHPEKHFEDNLFSEEDSLKLDELMQKKFALVEKIKEKKKAKKSAADETKAIKQIEKEVFSLVESAISNKFKEVSTLSDSEINVITNRDYPFFLFDKKDLEI